MDGLLVAAGASRCDESVSGSGSDESGEYVTMRVEGGV